MDSKCPRTDLEQRIRELEEEVSRSRKAEQILRETKQREVLQKIIDHVPVMIVFYHPSGEVSMLNRHALEVIGIAPEEMGHVDIMERCYPDPEYRREIFDYMLEAPSGWRDIEMVVRDGKVIRTSWANVRLSDRSYIGIGIDMTERKQAEEALRAYAARLEALNRELQQFAFVASHDLSEPLRKIQTFGSLLSARSADRLNERERDMLSRITGAADRMQRLLDALLRFSRVETRGQGFESVKLDEIVRDATSDLELAIQDAGVRMEVAPLPEVTGDPSQLRQLFENLIANAIKFHRPGLPPVVKIYAAQGDKLHRIFIEDNGIGFDENYLDKIFRPFQRLHGRSEYEGIGMGLAICRKIVERHGGSITASSRQGEGSTFIICLPAIQEAAAVQKGRIRILLADDHIVMRQGLSSLLHGHSDVVVVGEAADGEEAVQMARKLHPDVILMDISMPRMNGMEATKQIHQEFPHIRIIGMSMYDDAETEKRMLTAGAVAFMPKSGHSDELLNVIRCGG